MTDPLIEIAEEMDICLDPLMSGHPLQQERERDTVARWREKLRAFWTPQRKAFLEAAMEFQRRWNLKQEIMTSEDLEAHQRFDDAYLALVESERGESGNG